MEIKGRVTQVPPRVSGVSRAGKEWQKQEFILETMEQYPKSICFELFGDKVTQYPVTVGEEVTVSFDLESRESNERWYTSVKAWKVTRAGQELPQPVPAPGLAAQQSWTHTEPQAVYTPQPQQPTPKNDDLPF